MDFEALIEKIKNMPYGRNANRYDFSLVIAENKGTCSSKHAFLKDFSNKNGIPNVKLIIGIYKMTELNTPIGQILSEKGLNYIPEAHCYLKINDIVVDATAKESDFEKIKEAILEEIEIEPYQVTDFKIKYHQEFLKKWLLDNNIKYNFSDLWQIREECIAQLSK